MREAPQPPNDEELACRARGGCADAFERLVRRYQTPVLHFLRLRGCGDEAEDILQETFLRAHGNLHRYQPRWKFSTWLFTIARRLSINHRRRAGQAADGLVPESCVGDGPAPEQRLVDEETRQNLWSAAARVLSEEEYTAVWLHYVEGMPAKEIGAVLDRSWVSVKTMLFRARRRLLPVMEAMELDERPRPAERAALLKVEVPRA